MRSRHPPRPWTEKLCALALLASCVHVPTDYPCRPPSVETSHGSCFWRLGEGWTLAQLEAREAFWLDVMDGHPKAPETLRRMNFEVLAEYPACGGGLPVRGCVLGPTLIRLAGLPLCRSALAHELAHALFAAEGDTDYGHTRREWGPIKAVERDCPPLAGDWLARTVQALESWGVEASDAGVE